MGWECESYSSSEQRIEKSLYQSEFSNTSRGAFLVARMVKNPPAMQETQVLSLGQEDPLEKGMATHSSILAWRIPWTEESGRPRIKLQRVRQGYSP